MSTEKQIVIFAGTTEGRIAAEHFRDTDLFMNVYTATEYGAQLIPEAPNIVSHAGRMDAAAVKEMLKQIKPVLCVDATHPYAALITQTLRELCEEEQVPYLRIRRGFSTGGRDKADIRVVSDVWEAAAILSKEEGRILLTTGSKELEAFSEPESLRHRCIVRVLPSASVLEKCERLKFTPAQIIAMQGPFSEEMNEEFLRMKKVSFLVTKDSGEEGGCPEKLSAAGRAGVRVVMIGRPLEEDGLPYDEAISAIEHLTGVQQSKEAGLMKVSLIGMGPGNPRYLTEAAQKEILRADALIGSRRMLDTAEAVLKGRDADRANKDDRLFTGHPLTVVSISAADTAAWLNAHPEIRRAALLYSGDISLCSGAAQIRPLLGDHMKVREIPGISSLSVFLAKCGCALEDTKIVSVHGKERDLIPLIRTERQLAVLLGSGNTLCETARELIKLQMNHIRITVGERLTDPNERFFRGCPSDYVNQTTDPLSLVLFENPDPEQAPESFGIPDEAFQRGDVPMTKKEIRVQVLSALGLRRDSVLWDIGAGTGSVSVEAALHCPYGDVYAVERRPEAAALIEENCRKFRCSNVHVIAGEAPAVLKKVLPSEAAAEGPKTAPDAEEMTLPEPDAVFIGGSGGHLTEITETVFERNPAATVVITAVTDETAAEILHLVQRYDGTEVPCGASSPDGAEPQKKMRHAELTDLIAVRHTAAGEYHMRRAENPVMMLVISTS